MNIYLDMVGCRLNQAEIERLAGQLRAQGHEIVPAPDQAEAVVVNTCSVTARAASDSRQKIRQAARAGAAEIYVTGCWATLQPEQAAQLPNVVRVIPNSGKDDLAAAFGAGQTSPRPIQPFDIEPISRRPIPGLRQRTRAFIKAQDGCDNTCTFCVTTIARGAARSRPAAAVLADVQAALQGGAQEIVLTGVHLGSWGQDFNLHLRDLVREILDGTKTPRLRLSSLEPWDLDEAFFGLWSDARLCPHLHLPLQSGSATVLRRMLRKTSPDSFRELAAAARRNIPGVAITTDIITGFPGETEDEFAETLEFIREIQFAGGHVFSYSVRAGTPAARMKDQIPAALIKERSQLLHEVFARQAESYSKQYLGASLPVLWEASARRAADGWQIEGLTPNYLRVTATSPELRWNKLDMVHLTGLTGDGLRGEILRPA